MEGYQSPPSIDFISASKLLDDIQSNLENYEYPFDDDILLSPTSKTNSSTNMSPKTYLKLQKYSLQLDKLLKFYQSSVKELKKRLQHTENRSKTALMMLDNEDIIQDNELSILSAFEEKIYQGEQLLQTDYVLKFQKDLQNETNYIINLEYENESRLKDITQRQNQVQLMKTKTENKEPSSISNLTSHFDFSFSEKTKSETHIQDIQAKIKTISNCLLQRKEKLKIEKKNIKELEENVE